MGRLCSNDPVCAQHRPDPRAKFSEAAEQLLHSALHPAEVKLQPIAECTRWAGITTWGRAIYRSKRRSAKEAA